MKPLARVLLVALIAGNTLQAAWSAEFNDGPTVLITGGNRGIGFALVQRYVEKGWNIIATARRPEAADDLNTLAADYGRIAVERVDITDQALIDALSDKYKDQPIDVLINNAGYVPPFKDMFLPFSDVDFDAGQQLFAVNTFGALRMIQAFLPQLNASEEKKIANISSTTGSFGAITGSKTYHYRASKTALNMYTHNFAMEAAEMGIVAIVINPGRIDNRAPGDVPPPLPPGVEIPPFVPVEEATDGIVTLIDSLGPEHNGRFFNYDHQPLPF